MKRKLVRIVDYWRIRNGFESGQTWRKREKIVEGEERDDLNLRSGPFSSALVRATTAGRDW